MSYKDLLKARPADIIPPKPIPPGPFKVRIASHEFGTAGSKKTECVNFSLRLLEPGDEVDPDLLEAAKDDLAKAKPNYRVFITEDSLWVLKNFLTDVLKIPEADSLPERNSSPSSPSSRLPTILRGWFPSSRRFFLCRNSADFGT